MKRGILWTFIVCSIAIFLLQTYALNLGTAKGYVLDDSGDVIVGATINISVSGCTGSGCSATDTSDANGFYIEGNLNIIPGSNVTVRATQGTDFGLNSGIASGSGSAGVSTINVTICTAPQMPSVSAIADSHNNSRFELAWTTFKTGLEYDEFIFNSGTANTSAISPQIKTNLVYQSYSWQVRTCNSICCSDYATDTFVVSNSLPAQPSLSDQGTINQNTVQFNWTHSGTDPDGDPVTFDFQIDGVTTSNVTSPYIALSVSSGSHTWGVRACDGISCTSFVQDGFSISNSAANAPTLTDQGHTAQLALSLEWINYTDPDSNPTRNEFQLSTSDDFSTIVSNNSNAISPHSITNLSTFTLYHWRVRTCDLQNACSAYTSDSFFVYETGNGTTTTQIISGGSSTKKVNVSCTPEWECNDWNQCNVNGISTRTCIDVNNCVSSTPNEYQFCSAGIRGPESRTPQSEEAEKELQLSLKIKIGTPQEFMYNGQIHSITLLEITEEGARVEIRSEPKEYFIPVNNQERADLDGDGKEDIEIKLINKNHQEAELEIVAISKARTEMPFTTETLRKGIEEALQKSGLLVMLLFLVIVALASAILYQYNTYVVREMKVDKKLEEYIKTAQAKGFIDQQIKLKLLSNGFAQEEIDYVFSKMTEKKK